MSRVTTRSSSSRKQPQNLTFCKSGDDDREDDEEALEEEVSHSGLGRRNSIGLEAIDGDDDDTAATVSPLRSMQNLEDVTLTLPATNDDDDASGPREGHRPSSSRQSPSFHPPFFLQSSPPMAMDVMNETIWMDGRLDGRMVRRTDERTDEWMQGEDRSSNELPLFLIASASKQVKKASRQASKRRP